MASEKGIDAWEAALIKAMIKAGDYTNDQILAYFSRPERPLSPFRLSEIKQRKSHKDIPEASSDQLLRFKAVFRDKSRARAAFFDVNPLHPASLELFLPLENGSADQVSVTETDRYEFKESIHWGNKGQYGRTIAALANAKGGYLIFGIRDGDRKVVGIEKGKISNYDAAKLNQFLSSAFAPAPVWSKYEGQIAGETVGIIAVERAREKPVVCIKNEGSTLKEGAVYYRYPGETKVIKPAELISIVSERVRAVDEKWRSIFEKVAKTGIDNTAVLDVSNGTVSGPAGGFLIDEGLIDKLKFVTEGSFSEVEGDPTLRLIGDLHAIEGGEPVLPPGEVVNLSDDQVFEAFVERQEVVSPQVYVAHSAFSAKKWLPIFYFARLAGLAAENAIELIENQQGAKANQTAQMTQRIGDQNVPPGASQPHLSEPTRSAIIDRTLAAPQTSEHWKGFLKAVRTLEAADVDANFLLPLLRDCWIFSANDQSLRTACQYAIAHVDVIWHLSEVA